MNVIYLFKTDLSRGVSYKITEIPNVETTALSEEIQEMFDDSAFNGTTMMIYTWNKMGYSGNDDQVRTIMIIYTWNKLVSLITIIIKELQR